MNDLHKYLIGTAAGIILCMGAFGGYYLLVGNKRSDADQAGSMYARTTPPSGRSADILGTAAAGSPDDYGDDLTAEQKERLFAAQAANEGLAKVHSPGYEGQDSVLQTAPNAVDTGALFNERGSDRFPDSAHTVQVAAVEQAENRGDEDIRKQVRDFIVQGKSAARKHQLSNALSAFESAGEIMPADKNFEASSYFEAADSLFLLAKSAHDGGTAQQSLDESEAYIKKSLAARNTPDARTLYAQILEAQKNAADAKKQQNLLAQRHAAERNRAEKNNEEKRRQVVELIGQGKNAVTRRQLGNAASSFDKAAALMPDDKKFTADSYFEMADQMFKLSQFLVNGHEIQTARDKAEGYVKQSLAAHNSPAARNLYSKITEAQKKAEEERLAQKKAEDQRRQEQAAEQKRQQDLSAKRRAEEAKKQQQAAEQKKQQEETAKRRAEEAKKEQQALEQKKQQQAQAQAAAAGRKNPAEADKKYERERKQVEALIAQGKNAARRKQLNNAAGSFDRAGRIMPKDNAFAADSYLTMADAMFTLSETLPNQQAARSARQKAEDYINKSLAAQDTAAAQALKAKITAAHKEAGESQKQPQRAAAQPEEKRIQNAAAAGAALPADNQKTKLEVESLVAQGKKAAAAGNYSGAQASFQKAAGLMPSSDAPFAGKQYREMAESMLTLAQNTAAHKTQALSQGTDYAKKSLAAQNTAEAHFIYGRIADEQKNTPLAVQQFEAAQRLDPKNYVYNYELGRKYFEQKKYPKARSCFEQSAAANPRYEAAFFNLGITHKIMNANDPALKAFSQAAALKPDYVRAWIEIARIQDKKRNYTEAVKNYQKALSLEPSQTSAIKEMAQVYAKMKDSKQAERYFKEALTLGDTDPVTYYNLASVQLEAGNAAEALHNAEKSLAGGSRDSRFLYTYALALEKNKRVQEAENYYKQAIAADGKYGKPRINLGRMYLEDGKFEGAEEHLQAAYAAEPANFEVNTNLGKLYGLKHEYGKSIDYYAKAIRIMPKDVEARQNLAAAYLSAGLKENARDTYKAVLDINPQAWDSYYELGKVYISMNNTAEAKNIFTQLLKLKPNYRHAGEIKKLLTSL